MTKNIERRIFTTKAHIERRADEGQDDAKARAFVAGHAAVFDKESENLGGFVERIAPGAFDEVLNDDVRCLFNHDPNHILGRTVSGTLTVTSDATGLHYECEMPDTQTARDLTISMERGDVTQSSFAFEVLEDNWEKLDDDTWLRTILKVKRLHDVSPVTYPAYPDATTGISQRAMNKFKELKEATPKGDPKDEFAKTRRWLERQKLGV